MIIFSGNNPKGSTDYGLTPGCFQLAKDPYGKYCVYWRTRSERNGFAFDLTEAAAYDLLKIKGFITNH